MPRPGDDRRMRSLRSFALFAVLVIGAAVVAADGDAARASAPGHAAGGVPMAGAAVPRAAVPHGASAAPRAADAPLSDDWVWPVGPPAAVLAPFRAPPTPYAAGHRGIDLAAEPGAEVRSPADGVVSFAGSVAGRPVVAVDHGEGLVSAVEPVVAAVAEGTAVAAGQPIGEMTEGGHCEARCVHFGVRLHGEYVSPLLLLGGVPRAILLPSH